ncbi:MAG TPA: flagellar motor switch protein FliN [Candidatus Kapabacteria bacterium]|jgi:flagellar motor switch protein FliN/FliY|nr:flagellar motor switch protein FliN [Candidatus Kapabacteria bacterium]
MAMSQEEIDALINSGGDEEQQVQEEPRATTQQLQNKGFKSSEKPDNTSPKLELLLDLQLPVSIELGRTNMLIRDILQLGRGSVIEFDKLVSEPVDVIINGKKIAEGEVVVIDKHFGIRITQLIDREDRVKSLNI